jgi:phenylpropionate dioxygenase-like ring-hydroxylating dioxygenase large terminal subunit
MDNGGRAPVSALPGHWYVACLSRQLGQRPMARTVCGIPLALFRDARRLPVALLDRCPHRNVPLSAGHARDGLLECCYHGWRFDGDGTCRAVPGLVGDPDRRARRAAAYPTVEQDGFVWVQPQAGAGAPYRFRHVDDAGYTTVRRHVRFEAGLHAAVENTLDVPHTAFLHGGLFRGGRAPVDIDVVVRHGAGRVEAEYLGEPRPEGLAGRLLAPEGGVVSHVDSFVLPSIAQVEYRLGTNHLLVTSAFTPVSEFETDLHAAITFRLRLPHAAVRAGLTPIANRILGQDAAVLRRQTEAIRRFGGEHFASTELDVLSQHIRKLLRQAERGEAVDGSNQPERRVRMRV